MLYYNKTEQANCAREYKLSAQFGTSIRKGVRFPFYEVEKSSGEPGASLI